MKKLLSLILCTIIVMSVTACANKKKETSFQNENSQSSKLLSYDGWEELPDSSSSVKVGKASGNSQIVPGTLQLKYIPKYAKGFHIEFYYGGARIIDTHIEATATTTAVSQRVLILPEGATQPVNTNWQHTINGDISRVITLSSAHAGHFSNLDAISIVKGTSINTDSCYIPSLKTALTMEFT